MTPKVRFAPSPTGLLHVGNARIALVNWLFARRHGGQFLLRMDDTDSERSSAEHDAAIQHDLKWLGLRWDGLERQSGRGERYLDAMALLQREGRLYPCYETPAELALKRKRQLAAGKPPIYDRAARNLNADQIARLEGEGKRPHWRFLLAPGPVAWNDAVRGAVHFDAGSLSDPVLVREDGRPLYSLTSVVDDIDFAISHVIRGEDHVANTAAQIQMIAALGGTPPEFAHLALLTGAAGEGLSKRLGSLSVASLRDEGFEPMALNSLLARIGTSRPVVPATDAAALIEGFDLGDFGRAAARFDVQELAHVNAKILHQTEWEAVGERLAGLGLGEKGLAFWRAVRGNLEKLGDAAVWGQVVAGDITPPGDDADYLRSALDQLPPTPWNDESWGQWTAALRAASGRKGRDLFRPLRLALTGLDHGPEMKYLLPLIGPERVRERLLAAAGGGSGTE